MPPIWITTSSALESAFTTVSGFKFSWASTAPTWLESSLHWYDYWPDGDERLTYRDCSGLDGSYIRPLESIAILQSGWIEVPKTEVVVGVLCQPHSGFWHLCFGCLTLWSVKTAWNFDWANPVYEASGYTLHNAASVNEFRLCSQYWILHSF